MTQIGTMRERITWQSFTVSQDATGEPIKTWANLASVPTNWALIQAQPGGERFLSGGEQRLAEMVFKVTIRYRTDLSVKMRGVWGSRTLYIENIMDPSGRKAELVVMCREVQL